MRRIVYYVATSLGGFICEPNADISGFVGDASGVSRYGKDLEQFDTIIMGKNTYEFGYKFGLKPGQGAYQYMRRCIYSNSLKCEDSDPQVHVFPGELGKIRELKSEEGTDIYLCLGGVFAGGTA